MDQCSKDQRGGMFRVFATLKGLESRSTSSLKYNMEIIYV